MRNGHVLAARHDDAIQNKGETLVSLHPDTGDAQWTATVGDPSGWGIGAGGVYVESHSGMRAVALTNGDSRWNLGKHLAGGIDVTPNTVVTAIQYDRGPRLRGLGPTVGDVQWRGPGWAVTSHATANGTVYAGGDRLGAYAADTGTEHWAIRGSGYVVEPPIDGRLFVRLESGIHARYPDSGDFLWGTNATLDSRLALGQTRLAYVAAPDDPAVPPTLVLRDAATGKAPLAVTFDTDAELTQPLVHDGAVIVATRDGRVSALTP